MLFYSIWRGLVIQRPSAPVRVIGLPEFDVLRYDHGVGRGGL